MAPAEIQPTLTSPWRRIFEDVRRHIGNKRDADGVIGSINWLRKHMELRGANPNVVRNIIYRDKGKLNDKRVLFDILNKLWQESGQAPLQAPELEALLSTGSSTEQEVMQLLGREKRRAYRHFVSGVRSSQYPKMLVTGRPGSGKTLLSDYIQQALEIVPKAAADIIRLEFSSNDLANSLGRLARALNISTELFESRLIKIGSASAYAVQADAQADVVRIILDKLRCRKEPLVLLIHVSQSLKGEDSLGMVPLRLNTPEVPRVSATEWLWVSLLKPLSKMPQISLLVSMTDVPARAMPQLGAFEHVIKLNPPTASEARRFVKTRLPQLSPNQQEALVQRAGRSFEELRTLTLLAEIREPTIKGVGESGIEGSRHLEQLGNLVETVGDARLRDFLAALAVLSLPGFPTFRQEVLFSLRQKAYRDLNSLEQAFLDAAPGQTGHWRCFSRQLARALRDKLKNSDWPSYQALNLSASHAYADTAHQDPGGEDAARYLHHLFEARDWDTLEQWLSSYNMPQSLLRQTWQAAREELRSGTVFEAIAKQVAAHYVKLGSYAHPDVLSALAQLAESGQAEVRAWTTLKRAEGAVLTGRYEQAEELLSNWPLTQDASLNVEVELVRASIARWRSQLDRAADYVAQGARRQLTKIPANDPAGKLVHAKVAVWSGLIAKDQGDLEGALRDFSSIKTDDDLISARLAFQKGDVLRRLGRFDQALSELNQAVKLAHRSEAQAYEQARYLSRRGTLHRKRGELESASQDFAAALAILNSDEAQMANIVLEFERAKVENEQALNLLALGHFEQATFLLQRNLDTFERYRQEHHVDASYRLLRGSLRLSMAYWCRGIAQPYRMPLIRSVDLAPGHPDILHARRLINDVREKVEAHPGGSERYGPLHRQSLLVSSILSERPQEAAALANTSLKKARIAYPQAVSRAYIAAASLRARAFNDTVEQIEQARLALGKAQQQTVEAENGDSGLLAWLACLEIQAHVALCHVKEAGNRLVSSLDNAQLRPYHEALLRCFGEAVESDVAAPWLQHKRLRQRLSLNGQHSLDSTTVRLPDALVVRWRQLEPATSLSS